MEPSLPPRAKQTPPTPRRFLSKSSGLLLFVPVLPAPIVHLFPRCPRFSKLATGTPSPPAPERASRNLRNHAVSGKQSRQLQGLPGEGEAARLAVRAPQGFYFEGELLCEKQDAVKERPWKSRARGSFCTDPFRNRSRSRTLFPPLTTTPRSSQVATAGFHFTPTAALPDRVSCYLCGTTRHGWAGEEEPVETHMATNPDCALARLLARVGVDSAKADPNGAQETAWRLRTFEDAWPHEGKEGWESVAAVKMAAAGFIYTPGPESPDNATCLYCKMELDGWAQNDDPV
ncbi:hypothetical protein BDK51DRAFT_40090 [Blyttiomyces helicus]|uniref:BIR-domain-containing protein n=1 Tax=Blyttiomyces helicus TaxID=388810 RepID=A0A4P9W498_9FUNG|nr:hypothetical protein BDK51DRAFT_40090 [Blyttiomyces helicus]|eukprot:RKO84996.1 hypothetical protein BDK51DRAFT_40090 [Blyttiomyces helicus]